MKLVTLIANLLHEAKFTTNEDARDNRNDLLDEIEREYLPSGSGFDSGCKIRRDGSGENEIRITFSYHVMNDAGYYTRWIHSEAVVKPLLTTSIYEIKLKNASSFRKDMVDDYVLDSLYDALGQNMSYIFVAGSRFCIGREE